MADWQPAQFEAVGMLHGPAAMLALRKMAHYALKHPARRADIGTRAKQPRDGELSKLRFDPDHLGVA